MWQPSLSNSAMWSPALALLFALASAEVTIDLEQAEFDEQLGQFCVMQKVR